MILTLESLLLALIFGFIPPLLWLFFWLREDKLHPEPRTALALTFFTGMCMVILVIPLQKIVQTFGVTDAVQYGAWAYIEEIAKYAAAYMVVLTKKVVDEPLDPLIYMITASLGFAALENVLFLLNPNSGEVVAQTIMTGTMRFMGANVLHIACSSVVGIALAVSFYRHGFPHAVYALWGVILAGALHTAFNVFILQTSGAGIFGIFMYVWAGILLLLLAFEYIKRSVTPPSSTLTRR
jgi:RsiW-degrading membrane proteinase PrsW (M82 family)